MLHLDRLHRAICRMTESPFAKVRVVQVMQGTAFNGRPTPWFTLCVEGRTSMYCGPDLPTLVKSLRKALKPCTHSAASCLPSQQGLSSDSCSPCSCSIPTRRDMAASN
jgi:hypothetical protein